jgi:hypothetical protein
MSLPLDVARCNGRLARGVGEKTICRECIKCARRTDRPADMQSVPFMEPPDVLWLGTCPGYRYKDEAEGDECVV